MNPFQYTNPSFDTIQSIFYLQYLFNAFTFTREFLLVPANLKHHRLASPASPFIQKVNPTSLRC